MATFEIEGRVERVGGVQTFPSGFAKAEFEIDTAEQGSQYPNPLKFTLKKDRAVRANTLHVDDRVKVVFAIEGRRWTNPGSGKVSLFTDLVALKVTDVAAAPCAGGDGGSAQGGEAEPTAADEAALPF